MSASMLRQMLEDAGALLKENKYQQALDASRRVTQFDPNNFQAFMCVGLANFNLQQGEDSEEAYRRAAGIKPEMPAAWKNLVDLFDASKQPQKKLEPLEKLVTIFQKNNKVKACQKWVAEIAATALELKMHAKAFSAWHSLVVVQSDAMREICLSVTPNDELPSALAIWLDLVDLLQRPNFSLSDCATSFTQADVADQFFLAASAWSADAIRSADAEAKLDAAVAFFMRTSLDALKAAKPATKTKTQLLQKLDAQAVGIIRWLPTAKIPAEYLLLRSEDRGSPIDLERASQLALELESVHPKSPMVQIFHGLRLLEANATEQAQATILEGLAYCASSSFFESALCIRAQVVLASLALAARDVESSLSRLQRAKSLIVEKAQTLGCDSPLATIYSETKAQLLEATAREYSGDLEKALTAYQALIDTADDAATAFQAVARVTELLLSKRRVTDALSALESFTHADALSEADRAVLTSIRGWVQFQLGAVDDAKALLESATAGIPVTQRSAKAHSLKRLAIVYWHVGGAHRTDKSHCFGLLLQAAKLVATDSETFGWLGRWYDDVASDAVRAEKCYLKALALSSDNELAGVALSDLYERQQQHDANVKLWEDMTREPVTAPTWALLRLAQHLVDRDDERAVGKLHLVLRNDPLCARYWVTLGHVYRHFGKLVSAQKSYLKAVELGEASWCIMCELARIEGALLLFDEAFAHIAPFVAASPATSEQASVVAMLYAELLFKQAKYLCAEGLYGRAAANLVKASGLMTSLSSTGLCASVDGLKLLGDIHCFAFFLSPRGFAADASLPLAAADATAWVDFIATGRKAFEATAAMLSTSAADVAPPQFADVYYDVGLSCWYEAQALCTAHGVTFSGFEHVSAPDTAGLIAQIEQELPTLLTRVRALKEKAKTHFAKALAANPQLGAAWNGLGVVQDHALLKQFAWIRAIEAESSNEAAWSNLGMLYVQQPEGSATAALAQKALIHLQGVNANNPSMWNGYGMLARRKDSRAEQQRAIDAFQCALEMGLDMDALQGFASAMLNMSASVASASRSPDRKTEELVFVMRKVLERDPLDVGAWNALGVLQQRLGRVQDARTSFERAQALATTFPWSAQASERSGIAWNALVAAASSASDLTSDDAFASALAAAAPSSVLHRVLTAQRQFHASDGQGALETLASLLESDDLSASERDAVATVGLSIAGLLVADASVPHDLLQRVQTRSKDHLLRDVSGRIARDLLHVVEMHDRATGHDADARSLLEVASAGESPPASAVWSRLVFAFADFHSSPVRPSTVCPPPGDEAKDAAYAQALAALLLGPQSPSSGSDDAAIAAVRATKKLVRMVPWEPHAYALAGAAHLKRFALLPKADATNEDPQRALDSAALVLEQGLRIAGAATEHAFARAQLQWLLSTCVVQQGDTTRAAAIVAEALAWVEITKAAYPAHALALALLTARLQSAVDARASASSFCEALALLPSHDAAPILCELGAVYEAAGMFDSALHVWKALAALTASSPPSDVADAAPAAGRGNFWANLRLALVHGAKQNAKTAKKQIKVAASLAPSPESSHATVASFVESVLAKSA